LPKQTTTFEQFNKELSVEPYFEVLSKDMMNCMLYHSDSINNSKDIRFDDIARYSNARCEPGKTIKRALNKNFVSVLVVEMAINNPS